MAYVYYLVCGLQRNVSCTLADSDLAGEMWYEGEISDIVLL